MSPLTALQRRHSMLGRRSQRNAPSRLRNRPESRSIRIYVELGECSISHSAFGAFEGRSPRNRAARHLDFSQGPVHAQVATLQCCVVASHAGLWPSFTVESHADSLHVGKRPLSIDTCTSRIVHIHPASVVLDSDQHNPIHFLLLYSDFAPLRRVWPLSLNTRHRRCRPLRRQPLQLFPRHEVPRSCPVDELLIAAFLLLSLPSPRLHRRLDGRRSSDKYARRAERMRTNLNFCQSQT
jgi:hypothetical protein